MPIRSRIKKNYDNSIKRNSLSNSNLFLRKNIRHFEAVPPTYTKKLYKKIDSIKNHVNENCLSRIEPGHGNEGNKHLHKLPNRTMLCGATIISYELAEAVPTIFFHNYNESKKEIKHQCSSSINSAKPMINYQNFNLYLHESPVDSPLNIQNVSDLKNVTQQNLTLEFIYQNLTHIFKGVKIIGKLCCRKGVKTIDHIMKKLRYTFGGNEKNLDCNKTMTLAYLGRNFSHFSKEIYNIFFCRRFIFSCFCSTVGKALF